MVKISVWATWLYQVHRGIMGFDGSLITWRGESVCAELGTLFLLLSSWLIVFVPWNDRADTWPAQGLVKNVPLAKVSEYPKASWSRFYSLSLCPDLLPANVTNGFGFFYPTIGCHHGQKNEHNKFIYTSKHKIYIRFSSGVWVVSLRRESISTSSKKPNDWNTSIKSLSGDRNNSYTFVSPSCVLPQRDTLSWIRLWA